RNREVCSDSSIREGFFPSGAARYYVERAAATNHGAAICHITARHDGPQNAEIIGRWQRHMPQAFYAVRDTEGQVAGYYFLFDPRDAVPSLRESDPITLAWARHLQRKPLARGQTALFLRRWLSREHGEGPSSVQGAAWVDITSLHGAKALFGTEVSHVVEFCTICRGCLRSPNPAGRRDLGWDRRHNLSWPRA